jgi:diaminopimelate epimerase
MEQRHIPFKKMNGLGNDFAIFDARTAPLRLSGAAAAEIANRETGAGCDQVIVLEPSRAADIFMRIMNADGSEASACGNAARCVALLLAAELGRSTVTIETRAESLGARVGEACLVTVDMGVPRFRWDQIPLSRQFDDTAAIDFAYKLPDGRILDRPSAVNIGNPHCIFWVEDPGSYDLEGFGPALERDPLFPERANISLAEVKGREVLKLRVWERGAGLTKACGTAACAAAAAAARTGRTGRSVAVELPGGTLAIEWSRSNDHILMTGTAELEFEGALYFDTEGRLREVVRPL